MPHSDLFAHMKRATVAPPPLLGTYDDNPATVSAAATRPWRTACAPQRCYKICAHWHQDATTTIANEHDAVRDPDQAAAGAACACAVNAAAVSCECRVRLCLLGAACLCHIAET